MIYARERGTRERNGIGLVQSAQSVMLPSRAWGAISSRDLGLRGRRPSSRDIVPFMGTVRPSWVVAALRGTSVNGTTHVQDIAQRRYGPHPGSSAQGAPGSLPLSQSGRGACRVTLRRNGAGPQPASAGIMPFTGTVSPSWVVAALRGILIPGTFPGRGGGATILTPALRATPLPIRGEGAIAITRAPGSCDGGRRYPAQEPSSRLQSDPTTTGGVR